MVLSIHLSSTSRGNKSALELVVHVGFQSVFASAKSHDNHLVLSGQGVPIVSDCPWLQAPLFAVAQAGV